MVDKSIDHPGDEQYGTGYGTVEPEDVGVEFQLEYHHHLEYQIGSHVAERVAYLFAHGYFLIHVHNG